MAVSERDREHFRKIGRWKAEAHADALRRHLARPLGERLIDSIAWSIDNAPTWRWSRNGDGPGEPRSRARRLGLYRG